MPSKTITDEIYGTHEITSPVIIDLMESESMQRLKKITQFGIPDEYYHIPGFDRYVHSVGVMLLLRNLNASVEEQVSGLLHDVSHTAFSHVVDWVVNSATTEDFQDKQHEKILKGKEISGILKKYGYSPQQIADYSKFTLLEQDMPRPCADRVDYAFREFPLKRAQYLATKTIAHEGRIMFKDRESAKEFGELYLDCQMNHWGGYEAVVRYTIFAELLKIALDKKIIQFDDFMMDDEYMMEKLTMTKDKRITHLFELLRKRSLDNLPKTEEIVQKKFRFIDPEFVENGKTTAISTVDMPFKLKLALSRHKNDDGIRMPVF